MSTAPTPAVVCIGETLWDVLPGGEFLGGAPLNVAAHLTRLGTSALLASRVGADARGRAALEAMRALGLDVALVQTDAALPTGIARAALDATGSATYEFPAPAAWDHIEADSATLAAVRAAPAVVFGTLAQRSSAGAALVQRLVAAARWRVLDANLRTPHIDRRVALASLAHADFVKLNEDELTTFAGWLDTAATPEALAAALATRYGTTTLCVTLGARGALLWHEGRWVQQDAYPTRVADTIGAGDSFLAMLLTELLAGRSAELAMARAARLAAFVASQQGAVPAYRAADFRGNP
jgi:fructokinase